MGDGIDKNEGGEQFFLEAGHAAGTLRLQARRCGGELKRHHARSRRGEMADATDLKSVDPKGSCGFESRRRHGVRNPIFQKREKRRGVLNSAAMPPGQKGSQKGQKGSGMNS